jgi:predicted TIM-barrel fold metal-dependent hydrolase
MTTPEKLSRRHFMQLAALGAGHIGLLSRCYSQPMEAKKHKIYSVPIYKPYGERVIDVHMHISESKIKRVLEVMDDNGIHYGISIGVEGDEVFNMLDAVKSHSHRLGIIYAFDWKQAETDPGFFDKAPDMLEKAVSAGAIGLKNYKALGLEARDTEGRLIPIDDPRLYAVWERAERLGIVVSFHIGDPRAFFDPVTPQNERWEELHLHPEWSFADTKKFPKLESLFLQANSIVKNFPKIKFHYAHFGYSEDIHLVSKWMDDLPNLHLDVAARLGELGRQPADEVNRVFTRFQDRIMFGTDRIFYDHCEIQGAGPCKDFSREEDQWFYNTHWRYFQTSDKQFDHPTPVQGNWKINGIGLEEQVLQKLYRENARRLYRLERFIES